MSRRVKILVAEPSAIIREGILALLKQIDTLHLEVSELSQIEQIRDAIIWHRPDMLIVNPSLLGVFSVAQIKKHSPNPSMKCVALQFSLADNISIKAYDEVISIYDSGEHIREKITRLVSSPKAAPKQESLSQREKEVIVCVIKGMTNKQIAENLHLSVHTVITHRRNISAKLDIHSTAGLTIYAIVNKLVDLDDTL